MTTESSSPTLAEALVLYRLICLPERQLAPLTRQSYVRDLDALIAWLQTQGATAASIPVAAVTRGKLEHYLTHLSTRRLTPAYRRRKVAAIRSFFDFLEERALLPASPAADLEPPAKDPAPLRVLTPVECIRLRDAVQGERRDGAIIAVLLQTGLRLAELSQLRLQDVRVFPGKDAGSLTVQGRGSRQRTVPLDADACSTMRAYLAVRSVEAVDDRLFVTKFQRGMGSRAIERVVEKYLTMAGVPGASVHSLRHTYAVEQMRRGMSLEALQEALGHQSLATTRVYAGLLAGV